MGCLQPKKKETYSKMGSKNNFPNKLLIFRKMKTEQKLYQTRLKESVCNRSLPLGSGT